MMLTVMSVVISVVIDVESKFHCNWKKNSVILPNLQCLFATQEILHGNILPTFVMYIMERNIIGHI